MGKFEQKGERLIILVMKGNRGKWLYIALKSFPFHTRRIIERSIRLHFIFIRWCCLLRLKRQPWMDRGPIEDEHKAWIDRYEDSMGWKENTGWSNIIRLRVVIRCLFPSRNDTIIEIVNAPPWSPEKWFTFQALLTQMKPFVYLNGFQSAYILFVNFKSICVYLHA